MIKVVCGIIRYSNKFLVARNPVSHIYSGLWEFPGGKIEPNETNFEAIIREIKEELSLEVSPLFAFSPIKYMLASGNLSLQPIVCSCTSKNFILNSHSSAKWISYEELLAVHFAPTDKELIRVLEKELKECMATPLKKHNLL